MNYLIIDDEPIAHRIIEGYCAELPHLHKVGNAYNVFEASAIISKEPVNLIFLDINMPKMTGFEWLKTLSKRPEIIVTTAYREHALEGYKLEVVDYLLKPFSLARFLQAVNKIGRPQPETSLQSLAADQPAELRFFLKGDRKHHQIAASEILFLEAYGNYSKIYLREEMLVIHEKISALENRLRPAGFLRVHKSFLVAKDKIREIQGNMIHLVGHQVPIGQTYRQNVNDLLT